MSQWIGQAVSIECYELGVFQGLVAAVDPETSTVTLKNIFKNGKPHEQRSLSLLSSQIKNLTFIDSTPTFKNVDKHPRVESSDDDRDGLKQKHRDKMKPAKVVRARTLTQADQASDVPHRRRSNSFTMIDSSAYRSQTHNSPKRMEGQNRYSKQKNSHAQSDCFNVTVESCMGDFDFEKNLAMFDKQQVFNEIENGPGSRLTPKKGSDKYKHDEMVIKPSSAIRQIKMMTPGDEQARVSYTTDDGLVIPCISYKARQELFEKAAQNGFTEQRRIDMVGRNTSDMVFQLIGGSNRLNPQNNHQRPTVLLLCGQHVQGCYGLNCARHLANHNIKTIVFTAPSTYSSPIFKQELAMYDLCGCKRIQATSELPTSAIDLIINCLDSPDLTLDKEPWYKYISNWCSTSRAHVLSIDPPSSGCSMDTKWSVHIALPQRLPRSAGQTYLCDVSLPKELFKHIGVNYRSPFGIKFCIPLHDE